MYDYMLLCTCNNTNAILYRAMDLIDIAMVQKLAKCFKDYIIGFCNKSSAHTVATYKLHIMNIVSKATQYCLMGYVLDECMALWGKLVSQ